MSRSLNKVQLIGNLGADPEVRSTNNGSRVATLSLATSRQWTGNGGEKQEKTDWHRVICWNNKGGSGLADVCEKYLKKGDKVYVEGRIEYRTWEDNNKQTRYVTEVIARELIMLGSRGGAAPVGAGAGAAAKGAAEAGGKAPESLDAFPEALDEEDDDLPFCGAGHNASGSTAGHHASGRRFSGPGPLQSYRFAR